MSRTVSVVLSGIGGMGEVYLEALFGEIERGRVRLAGAVDPHPQRSSKFGRLKELGIPVFPDLEGFFSLGAADLAVISSPHQHHARQTVLSLSRGCHVLCEKPAAATVQEVRSMIEAERRTGRWVAVGYQWSFNPAFQELKRDILSGRFGRPRRVRLLYLWSRTFAYYARNAWAGRLRDETGAWILDSPAHNAMAHDLHNIFFLLGAKPASGALPLRVTAELYRAYAVENCDTAAARIEAEGGVEILFLATHVPEADRGPLCEFEFESGTVRIDGRTNPVLARWADGTAKDYGIPDAELLRKLDLSIDGVRTGALPLCGLEAAFSEVLCMNGLQDSAGRAAGFPPALVRETGTGPDRRLAVAGLDEAFQACFETRRLPSELGRPWAKPGRTVDLTAYGEFPSPL
ncbi:MAG: Gfo/Idh/MocA family oxidoreductase [Candidatus Aminicenantes bacterium]|nr:Gfo/Idh/MocA family oxidoreductase [Candidatus Aminicenantes bacterium]